MHPGTAGRLSRPGRLSRQFQRAIAFDIWKLSAQARSDIKVIYLYNNMATYFLFCSSLWARPRAGTQHARGRPRAGSQPASGRTSRLGSTWLLRDSHPKSNQNCVRTNLVTFSKARLFVLRRSLSVLRRDFLYYGDHFLY